MKRENFNSRLGFLLVSAGCAIGIGNVWRFPTVTGENGGGVFVLFYLLFLITMGIPVLTMELAVGRAGRASAGEAYRNLEPKGTKWHWHGWACLIGSVVLMMYYTTVTGWMMSYFVKFITGTFTGLSAEAVPNVFVDLLADPFEMGFWMAVAVVLGFVVCSFGLQKGLERISKWMMVALLLLIVVLAVHSILLPGAGEGLSFFLLPDWGRAMEQGLGSVIVAAMNQSFFTLSLGIGAMEIFGSYMKRDHALAGEAARICVLDTFVAVSAGLIIFPACFTFGISPDSGPSLIFQTLPNVFTNMSGGRLWGALFFLFMTFASFSTVLAVFENIIACVMDLLHWSRKKVCVIGGIFILIASLPCVLGYNVWGAFAPLGEGTTVLDLEDFIVSNLLLPLGSLVYLLFCVSRWGWGFDNYIKEANDGQGLRMPRVLKPYFQFILPILILVILVQGLVPTITKLMGA
ncbi:sodium-dependent transporter [uncultured Gemmiger sp.]|uniref:sodium-dependent transporter n=1 Tax=uncultured Gemmiger sp. TaxID=1623490 RepID=UPI0025CD6C88|nr:sodium-dependent transporter [uncultured Gemmiger sp.]